MKIYGICKKKAAELFRSGKVTVAIYGLGKMGLPLAAIFADRGAKVIGVDVDKNVVEIVNRGQSYIKEEPELASLVGKNVKRKRLKATTDTINAAKKSDVMIIAVPTLIRDNKPDLSNVKSVGNDISKGLGKGDLVITECTMPPGSTEGLISTLEKSGLKCGKDFGLAHCPERMMTGTAIRDISGQYPKIVGAIDGKTKEAVEGIYEVVNSKGVVQVSNIKAAECVKVFESVFRDVNIALANELALLSERLGVDAMEIFEAATTQPCYMLHKPGCGVGGHCIPLYPYFIMDKHTRLIRAARRINDYMPWHTVCLIEEALNEAKKPIKGSNILILGLTFRNNVKEFRKTPAKPIIDGLKQLGANVFAFDPLCDEQDARKFDVQLRDDFKDMDCAVIVADHKEFYDLDWKEIRGKMRTNVVVNGRQVVDPKKMKELGFVYRGVGRRG
jgi:UDP-N-acetyl-D-mannosaminuronic acid dehydrogenase